MIKFKIILEAIEDFGSTKKGEKLTIYNEIFNPLNGIAFFPIGKEFKIISYHQFVTNKKGIDIYENDIVSVRGTKRNGIYTTEVVKGLNQCFVLKENKTYLTDYDSLSAIIDVINNEN